MKIQNINIYKALPVVLNKQNFKANFKKQPNFSLEETSKIEQNSRMIFSLGQQYFILGEEELKIGKEILEDVNSFIELGQDLYFRKLEFSDERKIDFDKSENGNITSINEYKNDVLIRKSYLDENLKPYKITTFEKRKNDNIEKSYIINKNNEFSRVDIEYTKENGEKIFGYTSYANDKPKRTFRSELQNNVNTQEYFRYGSNAKFMPLISYSITKLDENEQPQTERYTFEGAQLTGYSSHKGKINFVG